MTIAIDFDGTWSRAPRFWREFIELCDFHQHRIIMVTRRSGFTEDMTRANIPSDLPIYYARDGEFKKDVCPHEQVDIWIDDEPGTIEPQRLLSTPKDSDL